MKAILTLGVVKNPHESHAIQQIKITKWLQIYLYAHMALTLSQD